MNIRQRIRNTFSRFAFLNQEPWRSLWIKRFMEYFIIFLIICIPVYLLLLDFNALPTQKENALLILTSIVQLQGAIIAIVITLTLIAIQMGASTYSPRVVDVMEKNPDMWYLLFFYLISISYGFFLLKQINDNDLYLVSSVYILGIFAIFALVPYMLNTNHLLRADTIVSMLVQEIDTRNISGEEDTLQPVFDMIYASIMRSDITTTRNGLMSLSDRIIFLLKRLEIEVIERTISIIYKYLKRLALIVIKNGDEEIFEEIIFTLQKFCLVFFRTKNF